MIPQLVNLGCAGVFDVTPHQTTQVRVTNSGSAAHHRTVTGGETGDHLLSIHNAQYTYPSEENKPHMSIAARDNALMVEKELRQTLARNVADRMHRDANLDTQQKLSGRSKIAQPHISRILRGTSAPTIDALARLARAFGCQPWELLVDTELTRQAALRQMILGTPAADSRVAAAIGPPPGRILPLRQKRR